MATILVQVTIISHTGKNWYVYLYAYIHGFFPPNLFSTQETECFIKIESQIMFKIVIIWLLSTFLCVLFHRFHSLCCCYTPFLNILSCVDTALLHNLTSALSFLNWCSCLRFGFGLGIPVASLVVQMVKNLPAVQVTWVKSLGQEDSLKKGMTTHSSILGTSLVAQTVKNLPAMQKTWVLSLGQEDSLEKGVATHFSILIWRIPWTEEPGKLCPWGHKELDMAERLIHSCRT